MLFTNQQLRTAYIQECYAAQKELSALDFMTVLGQKNIYISAMTASMVAGSFDVLERQVELEQELVSA